MTHDQFDKGSSEIILKQEKLGSNFNLIQVAVFSYRPWSSNYYTWNFDDDTPLDGYAFVVHLDGKARLKAYKIMQGIASGFSGYEKQDHYSEEDNQLYIPKGIDFEKITDEDMAVKLVYDENNNRIVVMLIPLKQSAWYQGAN